MATRAISVVVEKSRGGLNGWHVTVAGKGKQLWGSGFLALCWTREELIAAGAEKAERRRVLGLLFRELERRGRRRAVVTAEVAS